MFSFNQLCSLTETVLSAQAVFVLKRSEPSIRIFSIFLKMLEMKSKTNLFYR